LVSFFFFFLPRILAERLVMASHVIFLSALVC
jgi:hypothetical protein